MIPYIVAAVVVAAVSAGALIARKNNARKVSSGEGGVNVYRVDALPGMGTPALLYVPDGVTVASELVVFLHGDNLKGESIEEIAERHNLLRQIERVSSGTRRINSVWVAPLSRGKNDDFNAAFATVESAEAFFGGLFSEFAKIGVNIRDVRLVLAGQSRARVPIAKLLGLVVVDEVFLFDALYDRVDTFANFAKKKDTRFWNVSGEHTIKGATKVGSIIVTSNSKKSMFVDPLTPEEATTPNIEAFLGGASRGTSGYSFSERDLKNKIGFVSSPVEHKYTTAYYLAAVMG